MLKININNLEVECIIGILEEERKTPQKVIVDATLTYFYEKKEKRYIDYVKVVELITNILKEKEFELLEDAILYIRKAIKSNFFVKDLNLKITKPHILNNCIVSVEE